MLQIPVSIADCTRFGELNPRTFRVNCDKVRFLCKNNRLAGGGGSLGRTRLRRAISLLSGKIQGIPAGLARRTVIGLVFLIRNQLVAARFPKPQSREFSLK